MAISVPNLEAPEQWTAWLTEDPTGRVIALAALVIVALVVLYFVLRYVRWLAARWKPLFGAAVALGALYFGAMWLLNLGPMAWIAAGVVVFGGFLGFALYLTQA